MKAVRTQDDDLQKTYSDATAVDFTHSKDVTRQEFKNDADTNKILARFGLSGLTQKPIVFGERDFDIDLQRSLALVKEANDAWRKMPDHAKDRYPTYADMLRAAENGTLDLTPPKDQTPPADNPAGTNGGTTP